MNAVASSSSSSVVKHGKGKDQEGDTEKSEKKNETTNTVPFYKLFSFADSTDIFLMIAGTIGAVANGISMPLMTILFGDMIQSFGGTTDIHDVVHEVSKVSLKFVYLAIGAGVASFLQVTCWMATGERQSARIRNLYLKTILRQEIGFFDKETNTGEVVGRMSGDTVLIQDALGEKVGKFIQLTSTFFGGFIIAFIKGWLLSLVMLSIIPPLVIAGGIMALVISKMASRGQEAYAEAANVVEQAIGSIRTVASFTGERIAVNKYKKYLTNAYLSTVQEGLASGAGLGTVTLIMFCGYSLGVWYGSKLVLDHKDYTGGKVINVIFALLVGSFSLGQTSPCTKAFAAGQAAAYKMFEAIKRKPLIDAYDTKGKTVDEIRGDIEFRDVHFTYPARPDEQIFRGFSLSIPSGMTVALVGESGSGKSTVISLIERFYDPQAGEVLIDGINLKEFQLRWIRGKIGLVSQEPVLFASSIRDNIAYGKDNATTEEIRTAAELANASKFIDKMPQGLDTMVGEHGTQLSGGQKQRIAIARAILKDPRILLLDEATSALDVESERVVQEALDRIMTNRTTVIVAHRLSTVRNADTIAVIHRGLIVEKGSHSELVKNPEGAYCQLIRLQEKNQHSEQVSQSDHEKPSLSLDSARKSSQHMSINRSISRGSSLGNSNRHSFTQTFGLPVVDTTEIKLEEGKDTPLPTKEYKEVPLRRLAYLNKPEIPVLILGSFAAIVNGTVFPIFALLLSSVINTFYQPPEKLKKDSKFWALMFLIFAFVSFVALPATTYLFGVAGAKLIRRIRLMTFEKIINMEIEWFDDPENSSGAIGARLAADAATVRGLVGDALSLLVQNITTLVTGLVIAFTASWQLSLIILALIPIIGINGYVQFKFLKGFSEDAKMKYEEASQVATDAVGSIRTVASFSAEDKVMDLYKKKCEAPTKAGVRQGLVSGIGFGLSFFLLYCVYALCFYAGARLVGAGKTTFGKVFRVFLALSMAAVGISQSSSLAPDSSKAKTATASVFSILDRKSKIDPSDESGMTLEVVKGNIEFRHVSFKYPTRPDVQIFQDLCLTVQSGKTVALVGESGSGKSTAIALLQRFYNPDSGHILIDGVEIEKFQLRWLRQQMGLVSQEPVLFNETIRTNIAYGKEGNATEAEIVAAAESANAHKFICSLQQGYDTMVGERGIQLSGGQKQRVAIARAIVKEPKILLLDEATSALDAESERIVQDALDQVMVNRTTMVIAHRLSTIKNADLIAVVKNGVIVEKGKHDKLINIKDGAYASLVALHSRAST
ncbi:ABC transporter B family member 11-like isoform X2 [Dioscorea cayenensis subsp. rotundata]|uniref:ABC transporter B family member 11-like isoform X2 n=1 Tax=Dioscorea cayennensis subsp. rotundata TaxID=55577 RepID=A0AB40BPC1_DIOCR|nr:ABC transporter B family member 11-like isoform X2 [Dioscorea cayenensis subsp. rotundata]